MKNKETKALEHKKRKRYKFCKHLSQFILSSEAPRILRLRMSSPIKPLLHLLSHRSTKSSTRILVDAANVGG